MKGENSIKLYGNDLQALTETANKIKSVLATVQGITDLAVFTSLGQPTIQIEIDRAKAARYGLSPGDINTTIRMAIGGDSAGDLYEPGSDRHFPIIVRLAPEYARARRRSRICGSARQGPNGITQIPVERGGARSSWCRARPTSTASSRNAICRSSSRCASATSAARSRRRGEGRGAGAIAAGTRVEWVGEFGNLQDAIKRFSIVVPISLTLIAMLLWFNFGSMVDTVLAMSVIPMAIFGGVLACW